MQKASQNKNGKHDEITLRINAKVADAMHTFAREASAAGRPAVETLMDINSFISELHVYQMLTRSKIVSDIVDATDKRYRTSLGYIKKIAEIEAKYGMHNRTSLEQLNVMGRYMNEYISFADNLNIESTIFARMKVFVTEYGLGKLVDLKRLEQVTVTELRYLKMKEIDDRTYPIMQNWSGRKITLYDSVPADLVETLYDNFRDLMGNNRVNLLKISDLISEINDTGLADKIREIQDNINALRSIVDKIREANSSIQHTLSKTYIRSGTEDAARTLMDLRKQKTDTEEDIKALDNELSSALEPLDKAVNKYGYNNPSRVASLKKLRIDPTSVTQQEFAEAKKEASDLAASLIRDSLGLKESVINKVMSKVALIKAMDYEKIEKFAQLKSALKVCVDQITLLEGEVGPKERADRKVADTQTVVDGLNSYGSELVKTICAQLNSTYGLELSIEYAKQ